MAAAGIGHTVVNAHWCAPQVTAAAEARGAVVSQETVLLETGGGVAAALPHLGASPFAVANGDSMWLDGPSPALGRLAAGFDPARMDALLLLVRAAPVEGEIGRGDFLMATGSPGGPSIIQFVVKTLVSVLDWKLDAQQATSMVNFGANNSATTGVGGEHPAIGLANDDPLLSGLRALGHTVSLSAQSSGVATIVRTAHSIDPSRSIYMGGADPRREGWVSGD
jgi:hypothetical protein